MQSKKVAVTYEDVLEEFKLNAWESEHSHNQQGIYDTPRVNQRALREAFLAKKLLDN